MEKSETVPEFPASLGACADELYETQQERYRLQHEVDRLQARETQLKEHLTTMLPRSGATGTAGYVAQVALSQKVVPQVTDWASFWKYVRRNNAFELLQKRLSSAAVLEILESKRIPGVEMFKAMTVSVRKI